MSFGDFALAKALTNKVNELALGLETGEATLLEMVSETTAELLRWWFQQDYIDTRRFNFHAGQRQAILNTIYAHEVLGAQSLPDLYKEMAPQVLLQTVANQRIFGPSNAYPKYCMKMATGTGKTWVLQALLVWQVLNAHVDRANPKFTRNFLLVAPGLIVYDRLLDAFMGKMRDGKRSFDTSDLVTFAELFIPETHREEVFGFVQGAVCGKEDIGRKVTGGGIIAITNWHAMKEEGEDVLEEDEILALGDSPDPKELISDLLPLTPGTSAGNDLNVLNRRYERGSVLAYLKDLPSLMVFNDEAHHIHDVRSAGEINEVEWQKSLNSIADGKANRFVQVDFSATPYNQSGTGERAVKHYFPHIVVDFDLKSAMRQGLVKSLVLDKREEIAAIPNDELQFRADRDDSGNAMLAEGQRIMLRAGFTKLRKLQTDFAALDPTKYPKMLVMCEDTEVAQLVEKFFVHDEGVSPDDVLRVDSNRKGEMPVEEWKLIKERLFDVDRHSQPRILVSVLMLKEGFDVNNVCVIVPLRASSAQILLEQTIGRGLRLMWRGGDPALEDEKTENRRLIKEGKSPKSMIDVLSIVEHPAFAHFYKDLMEDGLVGTVDEGDESTSSTGELESVSLRDGFEEYDFAIPFVLREREEMIEERQLDPASIPPFGGFTLQQLKALVGQQDKFVSEDVQTGTRFGDYRVDGGIMSATGYNDFIGRLVKRLADALSQPITKSNAKMNEISRYPYLQVNLPQLAGWLDDYIRVTLFGEYFEPMADENWRVLLLDIVARHILEVWAKQLLESQETATIDEGEIAHRNLSEVPKITVRATSSILVNKCIYPKLPFPSRSGFLEKAFMEMASVDASVEAFCKINEQKHDFAHMRYIKEDGMPGQYRPDFFVKTKSHIYMVETKADGQVSSPNVKRKKKAAVAWCEGINGISPEYRSGREWKYVLLAEGTFYDWRNKGAMMADMLEYASLRPADELGQQVLKFE